MKLEEIRKLCDEATPGPWRATSDLPNYAVWSDAANRDVVHSPSRVRVNNPFNSWTSEQDARFIAASRTLMPKLLAVAEIAKTMSRKCSYPQGQAAYDCGRCDKCYLTKAIAALEAD